MSMNLTLSSRGGGTINLYQTPTEVTRRVLNSRNKVEAYLDFVRCVIPAPYLEIDAASQSWFQAHTSRGYTVDDYMGAMRELNVPWKQISKLAGSFDELQEYYRHSVEVTRAVLMGYQFGMS